MTYKALQKVPKDFKTFSRHYDKLHAASAHIGKAQNFGFETVRHGDYLENANHLPRHAVAPAGFDPMQAFDPRLAGLRQKGPDHQRPRPERRDDDPRNFPRPRLGV
ncbi:MAG: hypothetical protein JSR17_11020 [Proteobacteria bacterium]|nr:hypothetical protein [Pseudomonadota bacterium]